MKLPKMKIPFRNKAPLILTVLGCFGVVGTGVMAAIQTPKALKRIEESNAETIPQKVLVAAPAYLPAIGIAGGTIVSILGAHALNRKQQAKLIAGYAMLDQSYKTYRKKVKELYGEETDTEIRKEIVSDSYRELKEIPVALSGECLFYCEYADENNQWFTRTMEEVKDAEYYVNRQLTIDGIVTVNEFLEYLGLPKNDAAESIGWSVDQMIEEWECVWIDFVHESVEPGENNPDDPVYYNIYPFQPPSEDYLKAWYE